METATFAFFKARSYSEQQDKTQNLVKEVPDQSEPHRKIMIGR
jgi:hypothetical protein